VDRVDALKVTVGSPPLARVGLSFVLDGVRADVFAFEGAAEQVLVDVDAFNATSGEGFSQGHRRRA